MLEAVLNGSQTGNTTDHHNLGEAASYQQQ
jgi:hypothetical protein